MVAPWEVPASDPQFEVATTVTGVRGIPMGIALGEEGLMGVGCPGWPIGGKNLIGRCSEEGF